MALITKNTAENMVILLVGVLLFNGLVYAQFIGPYLKNYPLIMVAIAVALIVFADKIAEKIIFGDKVTTRSFIYILAGILLFNGIVNTEFILPIFQTYPWPIIGLAFALLLFKDSIANMIGG